MSRANEWKTIVAYLIIATSIVVVSYKYHEQSPNEITSFVRMLHALFLLNSAIAIKFIYMNFKKNQ
jgi:hypothetical protein